MAVLGRCRNDDQLAPEWVKDARMTMKSSKKRFKTALAALERSASALRLLAEDLPLLQDAQDFAEQVLQACQMLQGELALLGKEAFSEQMGGGEALLLGEFVDQDLISMLEEKFALVLGADESEALAEFMHQLLAKMEKQFFIVMNDVLALQGALTEKAD